MTKTLIRLKKKPVKPKRLKSKVNGIDLEEGDTLESILEQVGDNLPNAFFRKGECYDESYPSLEWESEETDDEYGARIDKYLQQVVSYEKWYDDNRDIVDKEVERRSEIEKKKFQKEEVKLKKKLEKRAKFLLKELASINRKL